MEPRIQYAKTEDGVSIAYWTLGDGEPLLMTPGSPLWSSLATWEIPEGRVYLENLARDRLVIRYDHRGSGHSDHVLLEVSFEAYIADIEAVAEKANLGTFALWGASHCSPIAIAYAVRHPERVSKVILWNASANGAAFLNRNRLRKALESADEDPELFLQIFVLDVLGWTAGDRAEAWVSDRLREGPLPSLQMALDTIIEADVTDLLAQLAAPTLILQRRELRRPGIDAARSLAAGIPNAHLVVVEGESMTAGLGDADAVINAIDDFLGDGDGARPRNAPATQIESGTAIILFADIANSTGLTEELGDAAFREKARALDTALRDAISAAGGTAIEGKLLGDGVLATFGAAHEAIACAKACQVAGGDAGLPLHVGIHAGDVIREDNNVFGGAVNVAARISDASEAGETLVSGTVRDLARTSAGVSFEDKGERELKGVSEPVQVFSVREQS